MLFVKIDKFVLMYCHCNTSTDRGGGRKSYPLPLVSDFSHTLKMLVEIKLFRSVSPYLQL